jgi:uncharacterized repeat protein (TIGR01451 family)
MATTRKHSMVMALLGALVAATVLALVLSGPAQAAAADLSIRKTTPDDSVRVGENFDWTLRVANRGPGSASDVQVVDTLPMSVRLLNVVASQGGPCVVDFPRVVCNPGTIASGGKVTIKLTVRATEAGTLRNRARVSGSSTDTNAANNRAVSVVAAR